MAQHYFVDNVRVSAQEYWQTADLSDPDFDAAMGRWWEQIDPTGERRAEVSGATVIPVVVLDE